MSRIEFYINLPSSSEKLVTIATNYEKFPLFFESQIKQVKILEAKNDETITEEILVFSTIFNHEILQKSIHKKINHNTLYTKIISGPFKGTVLEVIYEKKDVGTKVSINADLKLDLKYKILEPIIKKRYRTVLTGLLYKMNTMALQSD